MDVLGNKLWSKIRPHPNGVKKKTSGFVDSGGQTSLVNLLNIFLGMVWGKFSVKLLWFQWICVDTIFLCKFLSVKTLVGG